ncbi:MAG: cellulase family glycosylhydrolase [Candidatus Latescibacterota bacterium]
MVKLRDFFEIAGRPVYLVGINYQSAEFGHIADLWEDDKALPGIVDADFELMKRMGIMAIRIQSAVFHRKQTFDNILKYARNYGIYVMPNLNMGDLIQGAEGRWFQAQGGSILHVATESPAGSQPAPTFIHERPDPFDDHSIVRAKEYLKGLLSHYRDEEMILAWDIANEPTYSLYGISALKYKQYCGKDARMAREVTSRWTQEICQAAREADPNHPITVGTDHSMVLMDVGFDLVPFSKANDLMTTHHYSRATSGYVLLDEVCSLRDTYIPAFITAFSRVTGRPFASGECGNNSYVMSEEKQGLHYRMMLYSGLINGAIGAFPWCLHAYDWSVPRIHEGYDGAPAESEFGIVRPDHTLKPAAEEVASFARLVERIDFSTVRPVEPDAAVLLPESYYDFLYEHRASLFNAFVVAKQAHLNVKIGRAADGLDRFNAVIVPTTHLSVQEMDVLRAFVERGGSLMISASEALSGRISYLRDVVGFTNTDYIWLPGEIELTFAAAFGGIKKGDRHRYESDTLSWYVSHEKPENERQYFTIVEPTTAEVLAHDGMGRPGILLNRFGRGHVVCFTFPAEYCLGHMPGAYERDETHKVYRGLAELSGLRPKVLCDDPAVELGLMEGEGQLLLFALNHTAASVDTVLRFAGAVGSIEDFLTGQPVGERVSEIPLKMEGNGVRVFQLTEHGK